MERNDLRVLRVNPADNVAVALSDLSQGMACPVEGGEPGQTVALMSDIPFGHKAALRDIAEGENIIKYGYPIGHAVRDIKAGEHIHTHNLKTNLEGLLDYTYEPNTEALDAFKGEKEEAFFEGYVREDGRVGIRNEIWIIPTVGCVNDTAKKLADMANKEFQMPGFDGVYAYGHNMGCSQLTEDQARTQKLLAGLVNHPNASGVLVLSLGCENNNLDVFKPVLGDIDPDRVKFLVTQDVEDEYEEGLKLIGELAERAGKLKRETVPASKLVVGFKCGGSDAFSGITANPLCGRVNDKIVRCGGSTVLTEVPEMFGAERILMSRAVSEDVFRQEVELINNFKEYFIRYGQTIYENPSPGNKKGGISSLEEKSLGCIQKGGMAPVVGVCDYGEQLCKNGLNLLIGPGNDQVSCTSMTASGCQMILFTTGRGNPFGAPAPTLKLSTNSRLGQRKKNWIDYNAGVLLEGKSFEEATEELFRLILDIASGRAKAKNEENGYRDISVFRDGVIL